MNVYSLVNNTSSNNIISDNIDFEMNNETLVRLNETLESRNGT